MNPKTNKTDWATFTWNPVKGCRGPDGEGPCAYCYANDIAQGIYPDRFEFAGSMGRAILDEIRLTRHVRENLGPYRPRPVRWVIKRGLTILLTVAVVLLCLLLIAVI
jgi:protein gp37